ncbi:MAG TPA: hypothetical protein VL633_12060 [Bacteroidota bacterium]|nr:hypothetical protein [Bacteroidota bacterium]
MNKVEESIKDLSEIRSMMERSSKFLSLSGLSGVSAGIVALLGSACAYWYRDVYVSGDKDFFQFLLLDAAAVFILAVGLAVLFSTRMAKKNNLPVWDHTAKHLTNSLLTPLITGGFFCVLLWYHGDVRLIVPAMLVFYGLALNNCSKLTVSEIQYLALGEIVLGLLAMVFPQSWLLLWALGFGALHIVYGALLYVKYER